MRTNIGKVIKELQTYRLRWSTESSTVERLIEFMSANPECFERSLKEGHMTGSAWVVNQKGSHVLLTHHRKLNRWLQLGGHADGDSNLLNVAMREAKEESGLDSIVPFSMEIFDIDIHMIPERGEEPEHFHYDVRYALQTTRNEAYVVSDESHDLNWIEIDNLRSVTKEDSMLRMASKWKLIKSGMRIH